MLELRLKRVKCASYKYFRGIASAPEKHRHFKNITQDKQFFSTNSISEYISDMSSISYITKWRGMKFVCITAQLTTWASIENTVQK